MGVRELYRSNVSHMSDLSDIYEPDSLLITETRVIYWTTGFYANEIDFSLFQIKPSIPRHSIRVNSIKSNCFCDITYQTP